MDHDPQSGKHPLRFLHVIFLIGRDIPLWSSLWSRLQTPSLSRVGEREKAGKVLFPSALCCGSSSFEEMGHAGRQLMMSQQGSWKSHTQHVPASYLGNASLQRRVVSCKGKHLLCRFLFGGGSGEGERESLSILLCC